jgi:hypothetical protein
MSAKDKIFAGILIPITCLLFWPATLACLVVVAISTIFDRRD